MSNEPAVDKKKNNNQAGDSARPVEYARLVFREKDKKVGRKDILRNTTLIGASKRCNIQLLAPDISATHCVISVDHGILRIRDLRSRTGTRVNSSSIDVCELLDGDRLEIGPFLFRVETNIASGKTNSSAQLKKRLDRRARQLAHMESNAERKGVVPFTNEFVKSLVSKGRLTRFQAEWLMQGSKPEFYIDHFKVIDILGTGGMGWVYVAEFVETGENVALKVLNDQQDKAILARFELEARAGLKLNHSNIVRTFKLDQADDVYYMVMELVEGISVQELIDLRKSILWQQACDIIAQAASGLQHAHENGLVHRDVKPANFLIESSGKVKILDFGLALLDEDEDEFSLAMITGQDCMGTADYMAPEQSLDSFSVDARADIYGLGCTFYFALTGKVPFPVESTSEKLRLHRTKEPRPVRVHAPDVPRRVAEIVEKMMAKQPGQRYESAAEVVEALEPYALRQPADFDFNTLLKTRMVEARHRIAAMQKRQEPSRKLDTVVTPDREPATVPNDSDSTTQVTTETLSHDSTRPGRSSISLSDPFEIARKACRDLPEDGPTLANLVDVWPNLSPDIRNMLIEIVDRESRQAPK